MDFRVELSAQAQHDIAAIYDACSVLEMRGSAGSSRFAA
jgi:hypothetical protein